MAATRIDRRRLLGLGGAAIGGALLAACGRKGSISKPEGEEASYTYPRTYPDPAGVVPSGGRPLTPPPPEEDAPAFGQERTTSTVVE